MNINFREFARIVTLKESKKRSVNIAQVSEILKIILQEFNKTDFQEVSNFIERHGK